MKERRYLSGVCGVFHDLNPALEGGHLEEGEIGHAHVVKVHGRVLPREVGEALAVVLVLDDLDRNHLSVRVHTLPHSFINHQIKLLITLVISYYQGPDLYAFIGFIGFIGPDDINYVLNIFR